MTKAPDLSARFATGVALIALASVLIYLGGGGMPDSELVTTIGGWAFRLVVALCAAAMLVEWSVIHQVDRSRTYAAAALLAVMLLGLSEWLFPLVDIDEVLAGESFTPALPAFALLAAAGLVAGLAARRPALGVGIVYIGIPAFALLVLEWAWMGLTFWVMIVTWATDICAYFAGRAIGGPKLAPRISPNKTWAGLAGGAAGALLFGWIAAYYFQLDGIFLVLGAPMGLLAQGGDLFESWIKRRAGVKDSGGILPGHGGLLDRLDGLLPVLVATLALLMAGLWVE